MCEMCDMYKITRLWIFCSNAVLAWDPFTWKILNRQQQQQQLFRPWQFYSMLEPAKIDSAKILDN